MKSEKFELCKEHMKLLQKMHWEYSDFETGAPAVDGKRPYGNSYVPPDVIEILGMELPDENDEDSYNKTVEKAMRFHYESHTALEIILQLKTFEPGTYQSSQVDYKKIWKKVK